MKKFLLLLIVMLLMPLQAICAEIMPQYVSIKYTNTLGLYQASNEIILYKEPSEDSYIVHSISWIGDKMFPETVKPQDLFVVFVPSKIWGFLP